MDVKWQGRIYRGADGGFLALSSARTRAIFLYATGSKTLTEPVQFCT